MTGPAWPALVVGDFEPVPALPAHVWLLLLALTAQVGGRSMLAMALPRLPRRDDVADLAHRSRCWP